MNQPKDLKLKRRAYRNQFDFEKISNWHEQGAAATTFINTLSVLFPRGERFFIDAVRAHQDHPNVKNNPELQEQIKDFIYQEAQHTVLHKAYNEALSKAGYPVEVIEKDLIKLLDLARDKAPIKIQLAATIALEHYTSLMGGHVLKKPETVEAKSDSTKMQDCWLWHSVEETEHKSVAWNVWKAVYGTNPSEYIARNSHMIITSGIFLRQLGKYYLMMIKADKNIKSEGIIKSHFKLGKIFFGKVGFVRENVLPFMDYFKYKFEPWEHNNLVTSQKYEERLSRSFASN